DLEVDVGERMQAAEALEDVVDVENDVVHGPHSAGCTTGARRAPPPPPPLRKARPRWRKPSMIPPGRKMTTAMNRRPRVRCQPSPTKSMAIETTVSRTSSGRKEKVCSSVLWLKAEKMFSKYLISPA